MSNIKLPSAPNAGLFKQGYQTYRSEDGAVNRNIAAVREIAQMVRTSMGPCGRNKIVVNHLQKTFLTSDAATILRELEIIHPAAKLVVMASQQQEQELGDASNLVIVLAGEFLNQAEELLRLGLSSSEIIQGFEKARTYAVEQLEKGGNRDANGLGDFVCESAHDLTSKDALFKAVKTSLSAKQYGNEDVLGELVSEAVAHVMPSNPKLFSVDNVRVTKIMGAGLSSSKVIRGMVFPRESEGTVKSAHKAKVAVFSCPVDISATETKGTVLLKNANEMLNFSKGEEEQVENIIKELANSGVRVVICGAGVGELALHYMNKHNILAFKVSSKFDLRRLCRVVGASALARLGAPLPEEMGIIDVVETMEIGGDRVTVFRQDSERTRTATIVLRGATQGSLDDMERAIDDGVSAIKGLTKDPRLVAGAGACEMELASRIVSFGERTPGLLQHAIKKYGDAFEVIARTLAETAGFDSTEAVFKLHSEHTKGQMYAGVDVDNDGSSSGAATIDAKAAGIFDLLAAKKSAIQLATEAACTVLSVDQIIMAKRAGGPVMPKQKANWDDDD